ncbi:DODA-type extradiol aromatic ring-opening family dioxygenase [Gorillibacterium sp. sgz5001074]|uniref:DODA-type extradiol aromatic ring-opening family dioxygenase n=1 Tax=Gorillibacterium sp. sgz5001074 TaxID=3446695 RepID=UPI003F669646
MISPLFIAHGSPMMAVEHNEVTRFLEELGRHVRPKAIVIFTAHWEEETLSVSSPDGAFDTIYDFGGFPPELYAIRYPAPGDPALAARVAELLKGKGIEVRMKDRGLDHGSWVPLSRMYPEADIPVVQLSVNPHLAPEEQYRIGEALRELGQEDILVMGSGVTVHNLRKVRWGMPRDSAPEAWAVAFDDWLIGKLEERNWKDLFRYEELAPHAKDAVPREEHFVPLFLAAGSAQPEGRTEVIHRSYEMGTLSYLSLSFGA